MQMSKKYGVKITNHFQKHQITCVPGIKASNLYKNLKLFAINKLADKALFSLHLTVNFIKHPSKLAMYTWKAVFKSSSKQ